MITIYKVTSYDRKSTIIGFSKYTLYYKINKITRPKIGLIFAFDNLKDAVSFTYECRYARIYECQTDTLYSLAQDCLVYKINYEPIDEYFENLWITRNFALDIKNYTKRTFPVGTVWCEWVKPIKEIIYEQDI